MEKLKFNSFNNEKTFEKSGLGNGKKSLELSFNGQKVAFYSRGNFDPQVPAGEAPKSEEWWKFHGSPAEVSSAYTDKTKEEISRGVKANSKTLFNSKEKTRPREYIKFLYDFSKSDMGKEVLEASEIDDFSQMRELTPRQAMLSCSNTVIKLRNYDRSEVGERHGKADKMTALEMFNNLSKNPDQPLGVCRNYADMTSVLFQAVKKYQIPESSKLNNSFCTYNRDYNPFDLSEDYKEGAHKWNRFMTFTNEGVAEVILDTTNQGIKDSNNPNNLNFHLREPTLNAIAETLFNENRQTNRNLSAESLQNAENLFSYYKKFARNLGSMANENSNIRKNQEMSDLYFHIAANAVGFSKLLHENGALPEDDFQKLSKIGKSVVKQGRLRNNVKKRLA